MSFNIFSTGSLITDVEKTLLEDDMYDIEKSLESYNAKSHEKLNVGKTIFKVVV